MTREWTHLALGKPDQALDHARREQAICEELAAGPGETLFTHEALARAHLARGDAASACAERALMARVLERVEGDTREYCAGELAKLDRKLAVG